MGVAESQLPYYYIDSNILIGFLCPTDRFHRYSECIINISKSRRIKLKILPHVIGESLIKVNDNYREGRCDEAHVQNAISILTHIHETPPLELTSYDRYGFSQFVYSITKFDPSDLYDRLAAEIEWIGVNDFLLILATFADKEARGAIITESKILKSPVTGLLNELYEETYNNIKKTLSEAPLKIYNRCTYHLP
jgi:hypothetical protein